MQDKKDNDYDGIQQVTTHMGTSPRTEQKRQKEPWENTASQWHKSA
jgi:hypothetical protein